MEKQKTAGVLAGIAAIVAAAAGFGPSIVALDTRTQNPIPAPRALVSPTPAVTSRPDTVFTLLRGEALTVTNQDGAFRIRLVDVETLKKSGNDRGGLKGIEYNRSMPNARRLIGGVMVRSGVDTSSTLMDHVMTMTQPEWKEFVESHPADRSETIKEIPFAKISIDARGAEKAGAYYLKGDTLTAGRSHVILEEVVNTRKASGSPERASFRVLF